MAEHEFFSQVPQADVADLPQWMQDVATRLGDVETDLPTRALDADVVHKTGNETVSGNKTHNGFIYLNVSSSQPNGVLRRDTIEALIEDAAPAAPVGIDGLVRTYEGTEYAVTSTGFVAVGATAVTLDLPAPRLVMVMTSSRLFQVSAAAQIFASWEATGATTYGPFDVDAIVHNGSGNAEAYSNFGFLQCNAGQTTFTMKHRVVSGTGRFSWRRIAAMPVG